MTDEERLSAFLNAHQEEIVNWVSNKVKTQFKVKDNMFDITANLVNQEYPYGEHIDNMHRLLTNAIMCSLWCGWFSQSRTNAQDSNFRSEYVKKFRNSILEASYLATITRTNNRWKCEKCLVPFANLKLLKLHKEEYHSY